MKSDKGWASFHRVQWDHWVSTDKPYCRGYAWTYLFTNANYKDNNILIDGQVIRVKRGEHVTSLVKLHEIWGWSRNKVSRFLNHLEKEGMIRQKRTSKYTHIAIVNYAKWQREASEKGIRKAPAGHRKGTNNNSNKDNNVFRGKNRLLHPLAQA